MSDLGAAVELPSDEVAGPQVDDSQILICPGCERMDFASPHGLAIHMGRCKSLRGEDGEPVITATVRRPRATPASDVPARRRGRPPGRRKPALSFSAPEVKRAILEHVNPTLISGAKHVGMRPFLDIKIPHLDENNQIVTDQDARTVRQEIEFSDFEAGVIAHGVVEVADTPVMLRAVETLAPLAPWFFGVCALGVVGFHTWKILQLRKVANIFAAMYAPVSNGNGAATKPAFTMSLV